MGTPGCPCGPDGIETWRVATGILRISTVKLASTARRISVEQEHQPYDFAQFAFDGTGPLLVAEVVREPGIPGLPGPYNFSGFGMLIIGMVYDCARPV